MDLVIKILFLVIFFGILISVGVYSRKKATNVNGFVLGNRSVGPWLSAFSFGTSYFSAVIFVGYAGQFGWKFGMASTWIGLGNAFIGSLLAWRILGRRTRIMTQHISSATMPDYFSKRYESQGLKIAASVIIFTFLIPYTASLYNGLSRLFEMAFGIPYQYCVIGMSILTCIYVVLGGYMAAAMNDFIQGLVMLVGIVVIVTSVLLSKGGLTSAIAELSQQSITTTGNETLYGAYTSFFGPDLLALIGVVLLTSLGTWGLPQMVQKFYAIKSEKSIATGTIVSTAFAFIVAGGCYFLGGFGRIFTTQEAVDANGFDSIIPSMLENLSPIVIAIAVVLVLSASMSTLSSLVLTSSATITLDFITPIVTGNKNAKKSMSEKKKMLSMRLFVVVFIIISAVIAIIQAKSKVTFIAQLMGISWGALAGAFLAPFLYGLYFKKTSKIAVICSFILGAGIMIVDLICNFTGNIFISPFFTSPINAGVLAMVSNLILVPLISLIFPNKNKENVDKIFSCFEKKVSVKSKVAIADEEN